MSATGWVHANNMLEAPMCLFCLGATWVLLIGMKRPSTTTQHA